MSWTHPGAGSDTRRSRTCDARSRRPWTTRPGTAIFFGVPAVVLLHWQQPLADSLGISANWIYLIAIAIAVLGDLKLARVSGRITLPARPNPEGSKGHALAPLGIRACGERDAA